MGRRKVYNLFISHSWEYGERYQRMTNLLDSRDYFRWDDYSMPEEDPADVSGPKELVRILKRQIKYSSALIIISGMDVSQSDWIKAEINIADNKGKPILGVKPRGNKRTPRKVRKNADKLVNWNTESIVGGLRRIT